MIGGFPPPQASSLAGRVDALMLFVCAVAFFFAALIAGAILFLALKYHHGRKADRSGPVYDSAPLELIWTAVPLALVLAIFWRGASLFAAMREAPSGAMEIYVVGKQWMWEIQHPEGRRELNELHVPAGRPVKLLMTSQDVIHSFYVPDFRMKQDVLPGRYTTEWFQASAPGRFRIYCAQYCGTSHSAMTGEVVALAPADYERWLEEDGGAASAAAAEPPAAAGARAYKRLGCASCHEAAGGRAPALAGLYGARVELAGGGAALADAGYLRESILRPGARGPAGFPAGMPSYEGLVDEETLRGLIAYLESRGRRP